MIELHPAALIKKDIKDEMCQGLTFRALRTQHYFIDDHKRIIWAERLTMSQIKTLSCPGCRHCGYLHEYLNEFTSNGEIDIRPDVVIGALYSLQVVDISRDPETGVVDDWNFAFVKVEG